MTKTSPQPVGIGWEPRTEGIELDLDGAEIEFHDSTHVTLKMPMMSVRELRDDMEEASMLSRGLAKHELFAGEIQPNDWIVLMGDSYKVANILEAGHLGEVETIIQFALNTHSPVRSELTFPPDQLVTVWRPVE